MEKEESPKGGEQRRWEYKEEEEKCLFFKDPNWWAYLISQLITYMRISFTVVTTSPIFPILALRLLTGAGCTHPFIVKSFSLGSDAEEELGDLWSQAELE